MPRVIIRSEPRSPKFERFVKRLAQELTHPTDGPQPLILEEEVPSTRSRHVHVIWDEWAKIPDEQRTDVILEAYKQAESPEYADQITIATGSTSSEALALGLLPWKVEPILGKTDGHTDADYGRAVLEEEKRTVLGKGAIKKGQGLRYARKEHAQEAIRRFREQLPGSSWSISEDMLSE